MDKLVFASMHEGAGKTSIIAGIAKALGKKIGYMKPFGDRMVYRKKRIWDYDTVLMSGLFSLDDNPEDMCFGFDHSKLRYSYSGDGTRDRLLEAAEIVGTGKELLFIEGGKDLMYGTHVHLGSLSLAKHTGGRLVVVVTGDDDSVVDNIAFLHKYLDSSALDFAGVIINKVSNPQEFKLNQLKEIEAIGVKVLGIMPYATGLTYLSVGYLADALFAKVVAGERNLDKLVKNILIGAMSVDSPLQKIFSERREKLVITPGDRSDMILAALESDTVAILLTNGILPSSNIISKAEEKGVPLLLVPDDTFAVAKKVDSMEPLLTKDSKDKISELEKLVKKNIDLRGLLTTR
jgi:uncharacterized protein